MMGWSEKRYFIHISGIFCACVHRFSSASFVFKSFLTFKPFLTFEPFLTFNQAFNPQLLVFSFVNGGDIKTSIFHTIALICYILSFLKQNMFYVFRYTLQASTFQMAVLLQFNSSTSWTIQQLHELTQIQMDIILQVRTVQYNSCAIIRLFLRGTIFFFFNFRRSSKFY